MTTSKQIVEASRFHKVLLESVDLRAGPTSLLDVMILWPLKSTLYSECSSEFLDLFNLRIIVLRAYVLQCKKIKVLVVENIDSLLHSAPGLTKGTLVKVLVGLELGEGFRVVIVIWRRNIGALGCIKYFSLSKAEAPSSFELSIRNLKHISKRIVRNSSSLLLKLLEPLIFDEGNWH
jgi:hypothetical protein